MKLKIMLGVITLLFALSSGNSLFAQGSMTFTSGAILNNAGTIVFEDDDASLIFNGASASFNNTGTFTFAANNQQIRLGVDVNDNNNPLTDETIVPGSTATNPFPGTILFDSDDNMTVITNIATFDGADSEVDHFWFNNLALDGDGAKSFASADEFQTYLLGTYQLIGNGDREYGIDHTFTYANTNTSEEQVILGEDAVTNNNGYQTLRFINEGNKRLANGTTALVMGATTANGDGEILIDGQLTLGTTFSSQTITDITIANGGRITTGSEQHDIFGGLTVNSGTFQSSGGGHVFASGAALVNANGHFDIQSSTVTIDGSLTLNDENSRLYALDNSTLQIRGTYANSASFASRNNVNFADNSNVIYDGNTGAAVVGTIAANPYGNLQIVNGYSTAIPEAVNISGNYNQDVTNGSVTYSTSGTFIMLDEGASVAYGTGQELVGNMRRITGAGGNLTYNNAETQVSIPDNAANNTWIQLNNQPGQEHNAANPDEFNADYDVRRVIGFAYEGTANDWAANVRVAWKPEEDPEVITTEAGRRNIRYKEILSDLSAEKVSTNNSRTYTGVDVDNPTSGFRSVALAGFRPTGSGAQNEFSEVISGNNLFLTAAPTTYFSINHGRWSNPNTWDEGEQPGPEDLVVVQHTVHVGYERDIDNFTTDERDVINTRVPAYDGTNILAANVRLANSFPNTPSDNVSLLIGYTGTPVEWRLNSGNVAGTADAIALIEAFGYQVGLMNISSTAAVAGDGLGGAINEGDVTDVSNTGDQPFNAGLVLFNNADLRVPSILGDWKLLNYGNLRLTRPNN